VVRDSDDLSVGTADSFDAAARAGLILIPPTEQELRNILARRKISRSQIKRLVESSLSKKRGPKRGATYGRDQIIVALMRVVAKLFGISVTRNQGSYEIDSATSIMCEALRGSPQELSEQRLNRLYHIHRRYEPWIMFKCPIGDVPAHHPYPDGEQGRWLRERQSK
jgi:hypothetical protein